MTLYSSILIGILFLYAGFMLYFFWGLVRLRKISITKNNKEPTVSVIVAARNEEENIRDLLDDLSQQTYPQEKLQIIIADDRSTDKTWSIISDYINSHNNVNGVKIDKPSETMAPKKHALTKAKESALQTELDNLKSIQPQITYDQSRRAALYNSDGQAIYHIVQAWFKNSPVTYSQQSVARQVSPTLEFWDKDAQHQYFSINGMWAKDTAPDHVGFSGIEPEKDIAPNDLPHKVMIALKWQQDEACYGYAKESFQPYPDGRNPSKELPIGEYKVCVKLRGVGVNQDFWFLLRNLGSGRSLELDSL